MTSSVKNTDGTRTDTWKQSLPAAPYLTMMAVSNFKVVKDRWRNIEVNYYVDPEYEKYSKDIFGNVPEILDFYSRKLGVDYPYYQMLLFTITLAVLWKTLLLFFMVSIYTAPNANS